MYAKEDPSEKERDRDGTLKGICACDETRHSKMKKNKKALNDKKKSC